MNLRKLQDYKSLLLKQTSILIEPSKLHFRHLPLQFFGGYLIVYIIQIENRSNGKVWFMN